VEISLVVNGRRVDADVEPRMLLVHFLRDRLCLTGTHIGCESGSCGACTVHVDGLAVKSCTMLAVQAEGAEVVTIEGAAGDPAVRPLLEAFSEYHALQCGYCTPGMVMSALALLAGRTALSRDAIVGAIEGNLCRCTGYRGIVSAIEAADSRLRGKAPVVEEAKT